MPIQDYNTYKTATPDYLPKSFGAQMWRYAPAGTSPLFGLLAVLGNAHTATSVEHGYFSKTVIFPGCKLNGAIADGSTTAFTVDSTTTLLKGDMLRAQSTGEIVRVTAITSSTKITVMRGVGQIAAAAISDTTALYGVGNAFEQASDRPASRVINPERLLNNTQIIRNAWALPRTVQVIKPIAGQSVDAEDRMDCGLLHAGDIEKAIIFGQKSGQIVDGQWMTTMDGLMESVRRHAPSKNTTAAGSTTTYDQLETALDPCFDTSVNNVIGNKRLLLCGSQAFKTINAIGRKSGTYQIVDDQTNFGVQFLTFKTTRGEFDMIEHPLFNSNPDWAKLAMAVDPTTLFPAYLRQTLNEEYGMNGQPADNGQDAVGGVLTTELTMEVVNPSANAVISGLTAAA